VIGQEMDLLFFALSPGESHDINFNIKDEWWEVNNDIYELKNSPISVYLTT
jgi:hypothetical protein